jgi:hypothetical protein
VVLLFARSPEAKEFRAEVKQINGVFRLLASRRVLLFAAFSEASGTIPSNAPFVVLETNSRVATEYGVKPGSYGLFVIGPDGNIDLRTTRVLSGQRILDVIDNNYTTQARRRS